MKHENKTKIIFTLGVHISTNNHHISDMFKDKDLQVLSAPSQNHQVCRVDEATFRIGRAGENARST